MLDLAFVFDDATRALTGHAHRLAVAPLPATVYLMQVDVINHYRYALDHYLTVPLNAPFLQNSSLGTPYQKWAFFTNKDFELLSFAVHNLLRYTSRLVHEAEIFGMAEDGRAAEMKRASNAYTGPICEVRYRGKAIGVTVHPDNRLAITAVRREPCTERVLLRNSFGGPSLYFRIVQEPDGTEREQPIGRDEYEQAVEVIQSKFLDITDRARLVDVQQQGHAEVAGLQERNDAFRQVCETFYRSRQATEPFERLNKSYWT